eukprot:CAMPEP_0197025492 /NCGR_PEP_ID=MMETSP1384-20130603/5810_1 /TAXON_ID=29189 /ORGANISM="Ammonia sp." /LENGTH=737 /DNA_ID=CAMNT_0042454027 /DNA_START=46 /DNA_END=2259 /DNA_ORIENTATION=-
MAAAPASVFVEAEGNDSDDEGHTIAVDVWLSINRITNKSVLETFQKRNIAIEELVEMKDNELRTFCKELDFDVLTTNRIVKGVASTKKENASMSAIAAPAAPADPQQIINPTDTTLVDLIQPPALSIDAMSAMMDGNINPIVIEAEEPANNNELNDMQQLPLRNAEEAVIDGRQQAQVQHVIVSPQEHEAMESMYKRYDHTSTLQETIQSSFSKIDETTQLAKADLNEKFVLLNEQIKLRQEELLAVIEELNQYKKKALREQNDQLKAYRMQISSGKKEYERLISDVNLDIHKRKMEIMNMINEVMNNKVPLCLVTQPEIRFLMPPKAVSAFLTAMTIDNCDRPAPPILILGKVTFDTMTISWRTEFDDDVNAVSSRKAMEFQLCYAKFTKEFILSKKERKKAKKKQEKIKKKSKKKSKKSKRKKKKKSKYDSDSDSDSDSESGSSSSSSSDSNSDSDGSSSDSDSSSGVDVDELLQRLRGGNDDEKKSALEEGDHDDNEAEADILKNLDLSVLNWKRVRLDAKKKTHKIRNLVHGWSYLVRIRGKNESGWGEFSDPIKVSTKTINLTWDRKKHGKGITFLSDHRCKFSSKQAKVVVDYKVKAKMHKIFSWEFKLHKTSNYSWIGFVHGPAKQYVSNWNYFLGGTNVNEYSIGVGSGASSVTVQHQGGYNHNQTVALSKSVHHGDKFKFKANLKSKTVTVYHNGKSLGVVFQNIPTCIVPAASNSGSHMEISVHFAS